MTLVTIGELVVDWLAEKPGQSLLEGGNYYRCLGGNACNVAIGLARLGSRVRLLGKLGQDVDGLYLGKVLEGEGVDISLVTKDARYHTAQCYCMTGLDGEHKFYNWPIPNAAQMLGPEDISAGQLEGAAFLHATGISLTLDPRRLAVQKAVELAVGRNMIVSFDACFPTGEDDEAKRSFERILSSAHILKINYPELVFWSGGTFSDSVSELASKVFSTYQPVALAVTLGEKGSFLVTESDEIECQPFAVESVDGVGAGDGFMAGLLHSLSEKLAGSGDPESLCKLSSEDWLDSGKFANAVGALVTREVGALEGLPRKQEVLNFTGQPRT